MSCAIRGFWFSLLWPTYPFKYSSRFPYIITPQKTSYIVMLFLPYFDSFCKYKFIFHRRFLYYHRFSPFFFVNFVNFWFICVIICKKRNPLLRWRAVPLSSYDAKVKRNFVLLGHHITSYNLLAFVMLSLYIFIVKFLFKKCKKKQIYTS